jgi:hypothetical protein
MKLLTLELLVTEQRPGMINKISLITLDLETMSRHGKQLMQST